MPVVEFDMTTRPPRAVQERVPGPSGCVAVLRSPGSGAPPPYGRRGITLVEVIVSLLILACGLTALAHLTAGAVRAATVARVLDAGHASLGRVIDSLQASGAPGSGTRPFPDALGTASAVPIIVEWVVPDDPDQPARAWFLHPVLSEPVEVHFVTRAPW